MAQLQIRIAHFSQVLEVLHTPPAGHSSRQLLHLYVDYIVTTVGWQVASFAEVHQLFKRIRSSRLTELITLLQAGYQDVLHTCAFAECPHPRLSMFELRDSVLLALKELVNPLMFLIDQGRVIPRSRPSSHQGHSARHLGLLLYGFQSSYILLQPMERVQVCMSVILWHSQQSIHLFVSMTSVAAIDSTRLVSSFQRVSLQHPF
jgi:hypothetical protein